MTVLSAFWVGFLVGIIIGVVLGVFYISVVKKGL
jgi:ABC-type uncharacterized transport system permease subunit